MRNITKKTLAVFLSFMIILSEFLFLPVETEAAKKNMTNIGLNFGMKPNHEYQFRAGFFGHSDFAFYSFMVTNYKKSTNKKKKKTTVKFNYCRWIRRLCAHAIYPGPGFQNREESDQLCQSLSGQGIHKPFRARIADHTDRSQWLCTPLLSCCDNEGGDDLSFQLQAGCHRSRDIRRCPHARCIRTGERLHWKHGCRILGLRSLLRQQKLHRLEKGRLSAWILRTYPAISCLALDQWFREDAQMRGILPP